MKNLSTVLLLTCACHFSIIAQEFSTNRTPVGLEHNLLFNATEKYEVTQSGSAQINLNFLFDGKMRPSYSSSGVTENDPTIIEISGIPGHHVQQGAWFGWSTRWWMPTRFLMEGYDTFYGHGWITIADYTNSDYTGDYSYIKKMPAGSYTKLRLTIYKTDGENGRLGLSELFYIHPEATEPYSGLYKSYNSIHEVNNNIGIGITNPGNYKLAVNGTIRVKEVKIETGWADFVFEEDYNLMPIGELELFIKQHGHLPQVPKADRVEAEGVNLGEMNVMLLQKIEELTLYLIEHQKTLEKQKKEIDELRGMIKHE